MESHFKYVFVACAAVFLVFGATLLAYGQTSLPIANLREQLRARYDIVALQNGIGLVPHQRQGDVRLIEVRDGVVAINGNPVTAREARQRLGKDADLIFRVTYLDASAQQELARPDADGPASQANPQENTDEAESATPERNQLRHGDVVRIGGSVNVARNERVDGDVVAIGGSADVDGEVTKDVSVIGGSLKLGPDAIVRGDVAVIGGSLDRSPGAQIYGKLNNVGVGEQFAFPRRPFRRSFAFWTPVARVGRLVGTLLRIALLILGGLLVVALGGQFIQRIADRSATEPLRAGLAGLLAEVLFVPLVITTIVVLAISIIGIPLLILVPFGMVLAGVLMFIGFTGIAYQVGRLASARFGIHRGSYATVALGVVLIVGITLIARLIALAGGLAFGMVVAGPLAAIGYLAEYIAWTMGIGALILAWRSTRQPAAPAPAAAIVAPAGGQTQPG